MTPGIADGLALTYYSIFWSAVVWMVNTTFMHVFGAGLSSLFLIVLVGVCLSYLTVFISNFAQT